MSDGLSSFPEPMQRRKASSDFVQSSSGLHKCTLTHVLTHTACVYTHHNNNFKKFWRTKLESNIQALQHHGSLPEWCLHLPSLWPQIQERWNIPTLPQKSGVWVWLGSAPISFIPFISQRVNRAFVSFTSALVTLLHDSGFLTLRTWSSLYYECLSISFFFPQCLTHCRNLIWLLNVTDPSWQRNWLTKLTGGTELD